MDLSKVLAQLRAERDDLDAAILSLERLQRETRRRGRPPKGLVHLKESALDGPEPPAVSKAEK